MIGKYCLSAQKLINNTECKKLIIKLAKQSINSGLIQAFQNLEISEEEKLTQLEVWQKKNENNSDLILAASLSSKKLNYQTKAQQYQSKFQQLTQSEGRFKLGLID